MLNVQSTAVVVIIFLFVEIGNADVAGGSERAAGLKRNLRFAAPRSVPVPALVLGESGAGAVPDASAGVPGDDVVPEEYSQLEGRPKSSFQFQWDGAQCVLDVPLSHGQANTQFKGQMTKPLRSDLTPVVTKDWHPLLGQLELSFPGKCPTNYISLLGIMEQGRFSAESEEVGVVHPDINTRTMKQGSQALDVSLTGLKVNFETTMPLQLYKGQFGVAFKIKVMEGTMVAKNSTFQYSASLREMSSNGASSGTIQQEAGDVILSVPSLSYTFDTAQVLGSEAPVRLLLTFTSNITAEFILDSNLPVFPQESTGLQSQKPPPSSDEQVPLPGDRQSAEPAGMEVDAVGDGDVSPSSGEGRDVADATDQGTSEMHQNMRESIPQFDLKLLTTLIILCVPVLLSFFLSIGMGVNAMAYFWEEKALKALDINDAGSVSSIPEEDTENSVDIGVGVVGDEMMCSTVDFSAIRGIQSTDQFLDTDLSFAHVPMHSGGNKNSQGRNGNPRAANCAAEHVTGPTLKNLLSGNCNKGLKFEELFCAIAEKGVNKQQIKQNSEASGWSALDKLSHHQMNKCNYKIILHHISGTARIGELTGVFGPEGAGKSTLLNLISGRVKELPRSAIVGGTVNVEKFSGDNDRDFALAWLREDSNLFYALTVEEILINSAVLSNARRHAGSMQVLRKQLGNIVQMLDLSSILGWNVVASAPKLSSLQRRKISIAQELATMPDAFILDNVDAGLDTRDVLEVMNSCRKISKSGLMVLVAARNLSNRAFDMVDKVFLLSRGRAVYHGLAKELSSFLNGVGCPCTSDTPLPLHATRVVSKPSTLIQILTSPQNPQRLKESKELLEMDSKRKLLRVHRGATIELGAWSRPIAEPTGSPVAAHHSQFSVDQPMRYEEDSNGLISLDIWENEPNAGKYSNTVIPHYRTTSENDDATSTLSRTPPTPGAIALETAILEESTGQVAIPVSGRRKSSARTRRNSWTVNEMGFGAPRSDPRVDVMNTAGSEFGDSVLEFDILSNPPTWRSGAVNFQKSYAAEDAAPVSPYSKDNAMEPLTERSALLYRRSMNPFDSDSDNEEKSNGEAGAENRGLGVRMEHEKKNSITLSSPDPNSFVSLSPTCSRSRSPYRDYEDDYLEESRTPRLTDKKWPMAFNYQPKNYIADTEGDGPCGSLAFDNRSPCRVTVKESRIPRVTDLPNDRPIVVQPGVSKIAKPQAAVESGHGNDHLLRPNQAVKQSPTPSVPALNLSRVPSLNLKALEQPTGLQAECKGHSQESLGYDCSLDVGTPPRTGRSSLSGIIPPISRGEGALQSLPSHREQPFRVQPGTGVVTPTDSFDVFPMDWQSMSTVRSQKPAHAYGQRGRSMPTVDIYSEGTPEKIGNLDTSRSMAAYARQVASYAQEDFGKMEPEMPAVLISETPLRKKQYENSIRELQRVPFKLELASLVVVALRDIVRRRILLPLHVAGGAVLGLIMGMLFFDVQDDTKGLSQRVKIFYSLLCLLTGGALALFFRMKKEAAVIRADTRLQHYRPSSMVLVKACIENTCLRIMPVVVFAMVFLPMSGIQRGTLKFLLFISGLSMFWMTFVAIMYTILSAVPLKVGRYLMTFQLSVHGPLICGFLVPRFHPWLVLRIAAIFSAFCNVFEILTLSELSWQTGEIVEVETNSTTITHKHAYPSEMGLEEDRMIQDAAILDSVYMLILGVFCAALIIKSRWGYRASLHR